MQKQSYGPRYESLKVMILLSQQFVHMDRKEHDEGFEPLKGFRSDWKAQHRNTCCHVWTGLISEHL